MTIDEFQIQLDISSGNELEVLKRYASKASYGYLFVDSNDGQCYLFDKYGKLDDISKIKSIEDYAFFKCTSFKSIVIPDSVESIGAYVFYYCTSFKRITIPDSVKSIGYWAFNESTSLKEVIFKGKTIDKVKTMDNYPWCIKDISIIKCR